MSAAVPFSLMSPPTSLTAVPPCPGRGNGKRQAGQGYNTICGWLAARVRNLAMNFAFAGDSELRGSWGKPRQRGNVEAIGVDLTAEAPAAKFDRSRIQVEVAEYNRRF